MNSDGSEVATTSVSNREIVGEVWGDTKKSASDLGRLKAVIVVLTSAAAAYVLGGAVLALRLDQARFPVGDGLTVIPFPVILVTGIVELVTSALVGLLLVGIVFALDYLFTGITHKDWAGTAALALVIVALMIFVPLNAGGLAWPIALIILGGALWLAKRRRRRDPSWEPPVAIAVALVLAAVISVTLARYMVPPYRFAVGQAYLKPEAGVFHKRDVAAGGYLGETSDFVYLASQDDPNTEADEGHINGYARDDVAKVDVSPPPAPTRAPNSLANVVFDLNFSATPIGDVWNGNEYHGWRLFR